MTCGCAADEIRITALNVDGSVGPHTAPDEHEHRHGHGHEHGHGHHDHDHDQHGAPGELAAGYVEQRGHTLEIEQAVLAKNDDLAQANRRWLLQRRVSAVNLMSSPGAGKTSLLERTVVEIGDRDISVIEGDQETTFDAQRIQRAGARAVQVNTGAGCHLDASMTGSALRQLDPPEDGLVFIENVGNLVCPALFDLGEHKKVVVISVTEGDDKPLKYPHMFAAADLVVVNKTDLLPYVDFDLARLERDAHRLNAGVEVMALSVRDGHNLTSWYEWLRASLTASSTDPDDAAEILAARSLGN
ncbi:MAG: hydrogenase nickel incorporation protein HypB [Nocardioidaceae bacterium]